VKVLVTGAAGFIGSHTCEQLLTAGHQVFGVDDFSTGRRTNLAEALAYDGFQLADLDIVHASFADHVRAVRPEVIVHLAAQMDVRKSVADPLADARVNVLGTVQLLAAAKDAGTSRVVFSSSGGTVYGEPDELPVREDAPLRPVSPYGAAKVAGEVYVSAFAGLYGLQFCTLALGNVYGPRQDPHGEAGVVAIFARRLLAGAPTTIYGDGGAVRDYVYVDDVVRALELAAAGRGDGRRFNVGTGLGTTVRELHALLADSTGAVDEPGHAPPRTGELDRVVLDVQAAKDMGWSPDTSLKEGLARTVAWIRGDADA
jgi:UDP-glucose 4-epimerase